MKLSTRKHVISSIHYRSILNSHVQFTTEYELELDNGNVGIGSAPVGETISMYERETIAADPRRIIERTRSDGKMGVPLDQLEFDSYLRGQAQLFGRLNSFALSLAFFAATHGTYEDLLKSRAIASPAEFPHICMNILNGGQHAYTNPVLSDFTEFLLVSKTNDLSSIIEAHSQIQAKVKERLFQCEKSVVNGNVVNRLPVQDNRVWIDLLLEILEGLHLRGQFGVMIDASAGDLFVGEGYRFSLTDGSAKTSEQMLQYWLDMIVNSELTFLEDPFREADHESWAALVGARSRSSILGDNFYSSDAARILDGARRGLTNGTLIKPDQAGTVSATIDAIETAQQWKQIVVTSHRSISTESVFLSTITTMCGVQYVKIGPLATDYSSVLRLNELVRLTGAENG